MIRLQGERVELGLDSIVEVLRAGVRRAGAFVGFGINASLDPDMREVHLPNGVSNFRLLPEEISDEALAEIKREFAVWIQGAGFREICESLEQYMAGVYRACSLIASVRDGRIASSALVGVPPEFERDGLRGKLSTLRDRFGVVPLEPDHLVSLWGARNCLSHRRGIVGQADVRDAEHLEVKWMALDLFFKEDKDGSEHPLVPGLNTKGGGVAYVRVAERVRRYGLGDQVVFSPHDLNEIFWSCLRASDQIIASLRQFADARGVPVEIQAAPFLGADGPE